MAMRPHTARRRARATLAIGLPLGLAAILAVSGPTVRQALDALAHPAGWGAGAGPEAVIVDCAALAAWACALWLCAGTALVALGRLPGLAGSLARAAAERLTPLALRRILELSLSAAVTSTAVVAVGPLPASASTGAPPSAAAPTATAVPTASPQPWPNLDWPGAPTAATTAAPFASPVAELPAGPPAAEPARAGRRLPPSAGLLDDGATPRPAAEPASIVVHRGDSLWRIAERHLPGGATTVEIAAEWPRWYAANRTLIGPDPDLLLPGQRLLPPAQP